MRSEISMARLRRLRTILWFLVGVGLVVGFLRMVVGLGGTTALTDRTPWGFWIGFDILGGVALAAGGFVIAAVVYIFRLERYRSLLRPAVLTAFLGYGAVVLGLLFDLGRPWNIWRPMFFWQHHSALFEVAWCVMLYFTVLALEFGPVPLEGSRFQGIYRLLKKATLPLVVLGIMLSTLHQSSLGTLFLIMPDRVHPLWYTELLPLLFFVSAVALGLAMVTFESLGSSWLFDRKPEKKVLGGLSRALLGVLVVFLAIRFVDLLARGRISHLGDGGWESALFVFEILVSAIVPILLLAIPAVRQSVRGLGVAASLVVFGIVLNRMNVGGVSGISATGSRYLPSWQEVAISAAVVSTAILIFLWIVEHFRIYEEEAAEESPAPRGSLFGRLKPLLGDARTSSFAFVVGAAVALAIVPQSALGRGKPEPTPVQSARRVEATQVAWTEPGRPGVSLRFFDRDRDPMPVGDRPLQVLIFDGDRDGHFVLFNHATHEERNGGMDGCANCHHMRKPLDRQTSCSECHRDMYKTTDLFDHELHAREMGGNAGCAECHPSPGEPKTRASATACVECHPTLWEESELIAKPEGQADVAPSYLDAMHGLCLRCHEDWDRKAGTTVPQLGRCDACHTEVRDIEPRRAPAVMEAKNR
jgi:Ni/Fe-hydrogenase subunit HybB-like protein